MVNLHALGLMARVWGGFPLHSTETIAEQGSSTRQYMMCLLLCRL